MNQKLKWGQKFFRILLITIYICVQSISFAQKDVYLVIGQSNTSGRGAIEAQDMVTLPGVDLFNGTTWETATNIDPTSNGGDGGMNRYSPIRKTSKVQGLSFAYTFGKMTYKLTGTQIGLVVSVDGKEIFSTKNIQSSSYVINCSQWTPGVYFLTVASENGRKMLKLVKE